MGSASLVERLRHGVTINLFSPELARDPYPHFNALRERHPIHYSMAMKLHWIARFEWVQEVLRDKRFGSDVSRHEARARRLRRELTDDERVVFDNPSMLDLDPPDHTRIRRLAQHGFMHKFIQSLEPNVRQIVADCLNRVTNEPTIDIVEVLAQPLPAIVIADMMGLPPADHAQFQAWSEDLIAGALSNESEPIRRSRTARMALQTYFRDLILERRGRGGDDLIAQLIRAEEQGDTLSEMELYNTCLLLLVAGHETTTRLIGNGLYLLLSHPDQFEWLKAHPEGLPNAIEEMLRFEPPVQATRRFVTEDLDFHGTSFKRGDQVFVSIAAANRDPRVIDDPETFDIRRTPVKQVSFGYGIHLCIGASLARVETRIAFEILMQRYPDMSLVSKTPQWGTNPVFRGLERLEVRSGTVSEAAAA
jgi:cytochrome P450